MKTSCIIVLVNQDALEIKADATFTVQAGGIQSFADVEDLEQAIPSINPFATFEPDYWLLDGNFKIAPASANVGYMSTGMSAANTNFGTSPEIRVQFTADHSTTGLKLYFSEFSSDWCDDITITFRNNGGGVIQTNTYNPTGPTFETNQAVSNFRRIDIFLNSTNKAQRYARLTGIDFEELTVFSGTEIRAARLVEQIDPLSLELPISTLDLTLFSADGDFSIVDPGGFYANLQYKEPLDVYESINTEIIYIGRFYLDKWESKTENEATFEASDAIGLLDSADYLGFFTTGSGFTASDVIDEMMIEANVEYELDASLATAIIKGFIPTTSYREALQQIAFRIGAYVTCARSNMIRILPLQLAEDVVTPDHTLTSAEKGISSPLTLKPLVTGVEVKSHKYSVNDEDDYETLEIINYAAGTHRVFFRYDVPVWDTFDITGATDVTSGNWRGTYIDINVASPGTVTIIGSRYRDTTKLHSEYNGSLPAGTPVNIIRIADGTLVSPDDGDDVVERLYDYFQQRYLQKTRLFAFPMAPGDSVHVDVQSSKQLAGIVERMETDLAGGYVSDVEITGIILP